MVFEKSVNFRNLTLEILRALTTEIEFDSFVWLEWYHTVRLLSDSYLGTISCNTRKLLRKRRSRKIESHQYLFILPKSHHEVRTITVNESAVSEAL